MGLFSKITRATTALATGGLSEIKPIRKVLDKNVYSKMDKLNPFKALETKKTDALKMTPEMVEAEQAFLNQAMDRVGGDNQFAQNLSEQAGREARSFAAGQSGLGTSPNLALRAGAMAQQEAQNQANLQAMEDQRQAGAQLGAYAGQSRGIQAQGDLANHQASQASRANTMNFLGNLAGSAATVAGKPPGGATSDRNKKEKIENLTDKVEEFLDKIDPYSFEYKDEVGKEGEYMGVMAQDLEQSELGAPMVNNTPNGKEVDFGQGLGALLAAQAEMLRRIKEIEGKIKK